MTASSGSQLSLEKRRGPMCFKPYRVGFRDRAGPLDCRHHCHRRGRIVFRCRGSREDVAFCPGRVVVNAPEAVVLFTPGPQGRPSPPRLLLEGDVTATRSSFIFSAASAFSPLHQRHPSRTWLSWRLFQNSFLPRCCKSRASIPTQPATAHRVAFDSVRLVVVVVVVEGDGALCLLSRLPVPRRGAINLSPHWRAPFSLPHHHSQSCTAFLHLVASDGIANAKKTHKSEKRYLLLLAH